MELIGLDRQQILALFMVFLMIGSAVVYVLAYALG
jgi:hypothetical protein